MRHSFDLHLHTHYSADACGSPEAMVAAAKRRGLSGIAITDHNTCDAVDYLTRQGMIRKDGQAVDGFLIVPGVEVSTADGHLLCLGTSLPFMKGKPAAEVVTAIRERGGVAVAPILTTVSAQGSGKRSLMISIWRLLRPSTPQSASGGSTNMLPPMPPGAGSRRLPVAMPIMPPPQVSPTRRTTFPNSRSTHCFVRFHREESSPPTISPSRRR